MFEIAEKLCTLVFYFFMFLGDHFLIIMVRRYQDFFTIYENVDFMKVSNAKLFNENPVYIKYINYLCIVRFIALWVIVGIPLDVV